MFVLLFADRLNCSTRSFNKRAGVFSIQNEAANDCPMDLSESFRRYLVWGLDFLRMTFKLALNLLCFFLCRTACNEVFQQFNTIQSHSWSS